MDDNKFFLTTKEPSIPKQYQNFILERLNITLSELKFWEEDYIFEG